MKVILSRKGFDSSSENGRQPSPIIMPDRTLLSLPIPREDCKDKFSDLKFEDKPYFDIIKELKHSTIIKYNGKCHLDPDIRKEVKDRSAGWKQLFGQGGAAQTHLCNEGVKKGDLFLFFGWFRKTEFDKIKKRYKYIGPNLHVIFGYLQIGEIYLNPIDVKFKDFPHYYNQKKYENNCIYEASKKLDFLDKPGAGCFKFDDRLVLTKNLGKGYSRSKWGLPKEFKKAKISYHKPESWKDNYFKSADKGQEFVIQDDYKITEWAKEIIITGTTK